MCWARGRDSHIRVSIGQQQVVGNDAAGFGLLFARRRRRIGAVLRQGKAKAVEARCPRAMSADGVALAVAMTVGRRRTVRLDTVGRRVNCCGHIGRDTYNGFPFPVRRWVKERVRHLRGYHRINCIFGTALGAPACPLFLRASQLSSSRCEFGGAPGPQCRVLPISFVCSYLQRFPLGAKPYRDSICA